MLFTSQRTCVALLLLLGALTIWRYTVITFVWDGPGDRSVSTPPAGDACAASYNSTGHLAGCRTCASPWLVATDAAGRRLCRCMTACEAHILHGPSDLPPTWSSQYDAQAIAARGVRLVIGLGTGRCGTVTLSHLLRRQPGCRATFSHEQHPVLPWSPPSAAEAEQVVAKRVKLLLGRVRGYNLGKEAGASVTPLVGDVGSSYLPHAEAIMALEPGVKFVVLQRKRAEVVASFMTKDKGIDLWSACVDTRQWTNFTRYWAAAHPKLPCPPGQGPNQERSLGMYWDLYSETVEQLQAQYPDRVRVWPSPQVFHDVQLQREMLAWLGVAQPRVQQDVGTFNCVANCARKKEPRGQRL